MKIVGWFMGASIAVYVMMGAAAVLGVGLMLLAPSADASTTARSVCDTGFRGQPAYDRLCLATGKQSDAGVAWYVGYSDSQRKADCRSAKRLGGMRNVVKETRGDVLYDSFRNHKDMIRWTADMGAANCKAWGYKV